MPFLAERRRRLRPVLTAVSARAARMTTAAMVTSMVLLVRFRVGCGFFYVARTEGITGPSLRK